ncbi:Bromodomain-containing 7 [Favolaschia claudopus]|uniref:Bromodomain-containing 7 n=1 Tax=Favolaschia claudopus TaxID=2862362 RepID=A0AAW0CL95_9AGAR
MDDISIDSQSQSASPPPLPKLTLLLPPLKDLKKASKKSKSKSKSKQSFAYSDYPDASTSQKAPRPVKLKPLKEVLIRLVTQLKKKDDYAFFLKPVNPAQVTGYSDLIKRPMDLGTMSIKVQRGRYRSLEDFTDDFRLVTGNAKIFNPPGSIYYTEADKLEVWGLDQISKASSTVIQYETDWNIDVEKDDMEEEMEDYSMAIDPAADAETRSRSPSVSLPGAGPSLRRGPRGPNNKSSKDNPGPSTEKIDSEGRLPGSKDGLGAFPPGSDLARTMVALKLKGKRYKTKKERLRIEKDGPPYLPDGSLDYFAVEDPFSYLSALVPDPPTRPQLIPVYLPSPQAYQLPTARDTSTTPAPSIQLYPHPVVIPPSHPPPPPPPKKMKHFTVLRGGTRRPKDDVASAENPDEHMREAHVLDCGSFAVLAGELAEEMRRRGVAMPEGLEDADTQVQAAVRESLEIPEGPARTGNANAGATFDSKEYWSTAHALDAEGYIRDLVDGGVDGLAYLRSLAEFVGSPPLDVDHPEEDLDIDTRMSPTFPLGALLASWVDQQIVTPITEGRHTLLQRTALELAHSRPDAAKGAKQAQAQDGDKLPARVSAALHVRPHADAALAALRHIYAGKLDMAALIRTPEEVGQSEKEWAGKDLVGRGPAQMNTVLDHVAGLIIRQLQAAERGGDGPMKQEAADPDVVMNGAGDGESAVMRNLRLNLLALVKHAPVDTIAPLPRELVPADIQQIFVPLPAAHHA